MEQLYYKLSDLLDEDSLSYNKLWRSVETLRETDLIATFTGARGAICLTLDEKRILDKFLTYLDNCKGGQKEALYLLKLDLLQDQVDQLEEENRRLHTLVEVRPPWWKRAISLWRRLRPLRKAGRSQRQPE
ncbi:MAG: hypothetical protein ACE5LD_02755 [Candidatus Bipolaricaulia bacterium]